MDEKAQKFADDLADLIDAARGAGVPKDEALSILEMAVMTLEDAD